MKNSEMPSKLNRSKTSLDAKLRNTSSKFKDPTHKDQNFKQKIPGGTDEHEGVERARILICFLRASSTRTKSSIVIVADWA